MDITLSEFIAKTSCEPSFARDLLNHHDWNLASALKSYYKINNIIVDKDANSIHNDVCNKNCLEVCENNSCSPFNKELTINVSNKCTSEPSLSSQSSDACDSSVFSSPIRLTLKSQRKDLFPDKKLSRGISRASDNENLISKARLEVAQDFITSTRGSRLLNLDKLLETSDFTFSLPDTSIYPEDFCEFLKRDLIEKSTLISLESSKRLNWWSDICYNLYPLVTSGDGNCLLHAASLGMWGFHDRELILRKALHLLLTNSSYTQAFYRRWRWQTHFQNSKTGLSFSEIEWEREWTNVLRMASTEPRSKNYRDSLTELSGGKKDPNEYEEKSFIYESLEEIHIFVLAHVLRRPIIVIADTMLKDSKGEAFFPILFGGIYLPLECPDDCLMKSPLCLTYDAAHFSALVAMNEEKNSNECLAIPLMDVDHNILPLHFSIDPGEKIFNEKEEVDNILNDLSKTLVLTEQDKIELLKKYFDIITLAHKKDNCIEQVVPCLPKLIEKSQTLPSDFGRKNEFAYAHLNDKYKSKHLLSKSAAKMLLQRPFVSFGKMGKRIRKNLGQFARRSTSFRQTKLNDAVIKEDGQPLENGLHSHLVNNTAINNYKESVINTDNSIFYCDTYVLAAKINTNKHNYYEDMIKNYITTARVRFANEQRQKKLKETITPTSSSNGSISTTISTSSSASSASLLSINNSTKLSSESVITNKLICVNIGCTSSASASTNYLCLACFDEQKQVLLIKNYLANNNENIDEEKDANEKIKIQDLEQSTKLQSTKSTPELNILVEKNAKTAIGYSNDIVKIADKLNGDSMDNEIDEKMNYPETKLENKSTNKLYNNESLCSNRKQLFHQT